MLKYLRILKIYTKQSKAERKEGNFEQEKYILSIDHFERVLMQKTLRAFFLYKVKQKQI